ncbi:MAG: hypothetical protein EOO07_03935 [Chitinophagaceae bacterium]|nr:MAG: hypothetical protein EOO07_03935 [Chitinophagaceae bacterium]
MTEAIFTGKEVEEFSLPQLLARFCFINAKIARLSKNFFLGNRPCNAGYRYRKDKGVVKWAGHIS